MNSRNLIDEFKRPLTPRSKWAAFIPHPANKVINAGSGDVHFSVETIRKNVIENYPQAQQLAEQLYHSDLAQFSKNLKQFLYNNFQYLADGQQQKIRNLSYAFWNDRETGIDCKSYTSIAAEICMALGIKSIFRIIKQRNDGTKPASFSKNYSHIYLLIPKNQTTGKITGPESYYVIDGVADFNHEPAYLTYKDYPMNHQRLNGPVEGVEEVEITAAKLPEIVDQFTAVNESGKVQRVLVVNLKATGERVEVPATKQNCQTLQGLGCTCKQGLGELDWNQIINSGLDTFGNVITSKNNSGSGTTSNYPDYLNSGNSGGGSSPVIVTVPSADSDKSSGLSTPLVIGISAVVVAGIVATGIILTRKS